MRATFLGILRASRRPVLLGAGAGCIGSVLFPDLLVIAFLLAATLSFVWAAHEAVHRRLPWRLGLGWIAAVSVMTAAVYTPLKYEDRHRVGPFATTTPTMAALVAKLREQDDRVRIAEWAEAPSVVVHLPSTTPTLRELTRALERDAQWTLSVGYCGTSSTLLWGSWPMGNRDLVPIHVEK